VVFQSDAKDDEMTYIESVCDIEMKKVVFGFAKPWVGQILTKCKESSDNAKTVLNATEDEVQELRMKCANTISKSVSEIFVIEIANFTKRCNANYKGTTKLSELTPEAVADWAAAETLGGCFHTQLKKKVNAEIKDFEEENKLKEDDEEGKNRLFDDDIHLPEVGSERIAVASLAGGALVAMVGFGALLRRGTRSQESLVPGEEF